MRKLVLILIGCCALFMFFRAYSDYKSGSIQGQYGPLVRSETTVVRGF